MREAHSGHVVGQRPTSEAVALINCTNASGYTEYNRMLADCRVWSTNHDVLHDARHVIMQCTTVCVKLGTAWLTCPHSAGLSVHAMGSTLARG